MRAVGLLCVFLVMPALAAEPEEKAAIPEFIIQIRQHQFHPAEVKVPAGVKVRIIVDNQDDTADEFDSYMLHREKHIPGNTKRILYLGPLDPGRYVFKGEEHPGVPSAQGALIVQ